MTSTPTPEISQEAARAMLAALRHIIKHWPDSYAARHARAAIALAEARA